MEFRNDHSGVVAEIKRGTTGKVGPPFYEAIGLDDEGIVEVVAILGMLRSMVLGDLNAVFDEGISHRRWRGIQVHYRD